MITAVGQVPLQTFQHKTKLLHQSTKNDKSSFGMSREKKLTYGAFASVGSYFGGCAEYWARSNNLYHVNISPYTLNTIDGALIVGGIIAMMMIIHSAIFGGKTKQTPQ